VGSLNGTYVNACPTLPDQAADEVTALTRQLPAALVRAGLRDALGR
jgi:hypothetical protein